MLWGKLKVCWSAVKELRIGRAKKANLIRGQCDKKNSYAAHLTVQWSWEKIAPYQEALNAALKKYAERFPDDVCLQTIAKELISGQAQLWLVLKNNRKFSAFAITKVERTHMGKKCVVLSDLAGEGGLELVNLIDKVEKWARTINAEEVQMFGRAGWAKMLRHHGYSRNLIYYRKVLAP
ncbi:hypothetical protein [Bartonella sp. ML71XJBT]|uniref:hypothetical protein n=1 Tax=Bartonella sp. ML71XJBT TaxID=3019094 RepID=UPI0023AAE718|nr:hypothetical protein [Bartonella sp. ML71XJBT]